MDPRDVRSMKDYEEYDAWKKHRTPPCGFFPPAFLIPATIVFFVFPHSPGTDLADRILTSGFLGGLVFFGILEIYMRIRDLSWEDEKKRRGF